MAILSSTADLKKSVAISSSFKFPDFSPYIDQAIYQFTEKYVADLEVTLAEEATGPNAAIKNKARDILQNALTNFAFYIYTPLGSVFIDSSGFSNAATEQRQPLDWKQVKDLQRNFLKAGHTAMDRLLAYLEKNKAVFTEWAASYQYTESKELLLNNTKAFDQYYTIFESRQTYLALQPSIRQVEDQYLYRFLCPELIAHLKTEDVTGVQLQVKTVLQKAMAAYTVAKVCEEGLFRIDATGIILQFDVLPGDKAAAKDWDFLNKTTVRQKQNGNNYLDDARRMITENPNQFTHCESPILQPGTTAAFEPYNTQSVLGL